MQNASIQIRVTDTLRKALQEKAESFGVTISDYLRSLIVEDLKKDKAKKVK